MADYRDYAAEEAGDRARALQEQETGFRHGRFGDMTVTCLACGCHIGSKSIHREICPWPKVTARHAE